MKLYKLTDENGQTHNQAQWGEGVEHSAPGTGALCTSGWIHAYTDPLLAVLLNPIHGNFQTPQMWEAEGEISATDHGLKVGCTRLRTIQQIPLPEITREQRVRFGLLCALEVYPAASYRRWAENWLSGKCRGAADAAYAMAYVATYAATYAAAYAADAADAAGEGLDLAALARKAVTP